MTDAILKCPDSKETIFPSEKVEKICPIMSYRTGCQNKQDGLVVCITRKCALWIPTGKEGKCGLSHSDYTFQQ